MEGLGRLLEEEGRWAAAAEQYRRALEADPLLERLYRRLMACHLALGQPAEALALYERCRRVLAKALGVSPSRETEALRERCLTA